MSDFSRDWLRLREPADLAARNPGLARRFAAALPRQPGTTLRLVDLGAGSGANCRALMPRIASDQEWLLVDHDRALIAAQEEEFTLWARRQGYPILAGGGRITITSGVARWSIASLPLDLAREDASFMRFKPDAVTAAAFFDLVSPSWLDRFVDRVAAQRVPVLAVLTVDGVRTWTPPLVEDAAVAQGFRRHQARDKGLGRALGGDAATGLAAAFRERGFRIEETPSPWRLDHRHGPLLAALIAGEVRAARESSPDQAINIAEWEKKRLEQHRVGLLALEIGHRDLLALPG